MALRAQLSWSMATTNKPLRPGRAPELVLESRLLNLVVKIVLQHGVIPGWRHMKAHGILRVL
jgi:hypothetical protein